jgi:hypothetical protein
MSDTIIGYSGPKVLLGYPVGTSELVCFSDSLRLLMQYEGMKPEGPLLAGIVREQGLYVDDNRNRLVEHLFKAPQSVKWLLMIDTDIEFKPYILELMLELAENHDLKILAASVPIGQTHETCAFFFGDVPGRMHVVTRLPHGPLRPLRVDAIATACTLIHRDVFEAMAEKLGPCWFTRFSVPDPDSKQDGPIESRRDLTLGEDIAFCYRAKSLGMPIWCAHIPGLRHWKLVGFTHDEASEWPQRETKTERVVVSDPATGNLTELVEG